MTNIVKKQIVEELAFQSERLSQAKMAYRLRVSTATVSQMLNGYWTHIASELWRKVMINLRVDPHWKVVEDTSVQKLMTAYLGHVQARGLAVGISEQAGVGKSEAYRSYMRAHAAVIHVECKRYWSKKSYVRTLCGTAGLDGKGTTEELIERFIDHLKTLERPLLILDQADKLKDNQLDLFMDMYNELNGCCGFVLSGVLALKKRVLRGIQYDKLGYRELWSRIGSKFFDAFPETSYSDVRKICAANGVADEPDAREIYDLSEGDLRKVRREVEKALLQNKRQAA